MPGFLWARYLHSHSIALAKVPVLLLLRCLGYWHAGGCLIPCLMTNPLYRFATKERNGLLLYNGRFNEKHDFVALEVIQEQVQLTFSAGEPVPHVLAHLLRSYVSEPLTSSHAPPSQSNLDLASIPRPAHFSATPNSLPVTQLTWSFL